MSILFKILRKMAVGLGIILGIYSVICVIVGILGIIIYTSVILALPMLQWYADLLLWISRELGGR